MMNSLNEIIAQRLQALREVMCRERLAAFIFSSTDPHQSEYVADHWKSLEWISGFNGTAATAVVTMDAAALWIDSRFSLAAGWQLADTEFQLMKQEMPGTPTIAEWIGSLPPTSSIGRGTSTEVGVDGTLFSTTEVRGLVTELRRHGGFTLRTNLDPLRDIWPDRPPLPQSPAFVMPLADGGETAHRKIERLRHALRQEHADGMLMASLDDIAWTLNLCGSDVQGRHVVVSYLLVDSQHATLYISPAKVTDEVSRYLQQEGVGVDSYENVKRGLKDYFQYNILLDPDEANYTLYNTVKTQNAAGCRIVEAASPVKRMKTI